MLALSLQRFPACGSDNSEPHPSFCSTQTFYTPDICSRGAQIMTSAAEYLEYTSTLSIEERRALLTVPKRMVAAALSRTTDCPRCQFLHHVSSCLMPTSSSIANDGASAVERLFEITKERTLSLWQFLWNFESNIQLSPSLLQDDKLLQSFLLQSIALLQSAQTETCERHKGSPGPSELTTALKRLQSKEREMEELLGCTSDPLNSSESAFCICTGARLCEETDEGDAVQPLNSQNPVTNALQQVRSRRCRLLKAYDLGLHEGCLKLLSIVCGVMWSNVIASYHSHQASRAWSTLVSNASLASSGTIEEVVDTIARVDNEETSLLSNTLGELQQRCNEYQDLYMEALKRLDSITTNLAKAEAERQQVEASSRLSWAQWQGQVEALEMLSETELQQLSSDMEQALLRVRLQLAQAKVPKDAMCPICWENSKDIAFGCGHRVCGSCSDKVSLCPICRKDVNMRIKLFA